MVLFSSQHPSQLRWLLRSSPKQASKHKWLEYRLITSRMIDIIHIRTATTIVITIITISTHIIIRIISIKITTVVTITTLVV